MNLLDLKEFDKNKTKVLKYILYKKRTEAEVKKKFINKIPEEQLEKIIEFLKEEKYIDDNIYIEKTINEYIRLKNLSIKELKYKLIFKGIEKLKIEKYFDENEEKILNYEIQSIKNIIIKKENIIDLLEIKTYLFKKGFKKELIDIILNKKK